MRLLSLFVASSTIRSGGGSTAPPHDGSQRAITTLRRTLVASSTFCGRRLTANEATGPRHGVHTARDSEVDAVAIDASEKIEAASSTTRRSPFGALTRGRIRGQPFREVAHDVDGRGSVTGRWSRVNHGGMGELQGFPSWTNTPAAHGVCTGRGHQPASQRQRAK